MQTIKNYCASFGLLLGLLFGLCSSGWSIAQITMPVGDELYLPRLGQSGKDVIWLPTSTELMTQMLKIAKVSPTDLVYDLGAGDGKIAIAAAKEFGANAIGIEFNADMAAFAKRSVSRAGLTDKVKIINGDIFKEDFSKATVLTLYLLPELNIQLRPTILKMKPGTRVVSNTFDMEDWEADIEIGNPARAFYWLVPANIAGNWTLKGLDPIHSGVLKIEQRFQKVAGTLTINQQVHSLLSPSLAGELLKFSYLDKNDHLHQVQLTWSPNGLSGEHKANSQTTNVVGTR